MTKFSVNNRTDALKTDINLLFTTTDCRISVDVRRRVDALHEFQIHVSVRILTIKFSQWARVNFCSYRQKGNWFPSIELRFLTAHDFRVISARTWDFSQTKLDSEINSPFLLNEHGDPDFFSGIC